jgi:hypothetical protein
VAIGTEGHKVIEGVVTQLAPLDFVVDLEIFQQSALLTPPSVLLQHPLHQPPVNLPPQFDPHYLPEHL